MENRRSDTGIHSEHTEIRYASVPSENVRLDGNMYYRIKNQIDAFALAEDIRCSNSILSDRIREIAEMLDENYSGHRGSRDWGGYILFFPTKEGYENQIEKILRYHHLDPALYEYEEIIGECAIGNVRWHEKLWLLSSEDALVFIFPEEVRQYV